jgi:hypothetical protein
MLKVSHFEKYKAMFEDLENNSAEYVSSMSLERTYYLLALK